MESENRIDDKSDWRIRQQRIDHFPIEDKTSSIDSLYRELMKRHTRVAKLDDHLDDDRLAHKPACVLGQSKEGVVEGVKGCWRLVHHRIHKQNLKLLIQTTHVLENE